MGAIGGTTMRMVAESKERGDIPVCDKPNAAPGTTITPIGSALGNMGFATERDATSATVPSSDIELTFIDESGHCDAA